MNGTSLLLMVTMLGSINSLYAMEKNDTSCATEIKATSIDDARYENVMKKLHQQKLTLLETYAFNNKEILENYEEVAQYNYRYQRKDGPYEMDTSTCSQAKTIRENVRRSNFIAKQNHGVIQMITDIQRILHSELKNEEIVPNATVVQNTEV